MLGLGLFYFILNSAPLTRDVTCSRPYLDGKNMKRLNEMLNEQPLRLDRNTRFFI